MKSSCRTRIFGFFFFSEGKFAFTKMELYHCSEKTNKHIGNYDVTSASIWK